MILNICVIGCGKIVDDHIVEVQKLSCARVLAICDLEPILAEQIALRCSVSLWYTDLDSMLFE
jgi:predicted dehydrogenase